MTRSEDSLFIRTCKRQPVERTPVWIMRQAGRYLPEYRQVRAQADFLTMCKTPELAAEVTLQPVDLIGVDAAIIFSDILVIPEAMGMELTFTEGIGPVLADPIRNVDDAGRLQPVDPLDELRYVMDAISTVKHELNGRVPVIGFSGSPWTLLCYMVEGGGSKNFGQVKKLIYNNPGLAQDLLSRLAKIVGDYLSAQLEAGADALQIFDSWGGILAPDEFKEFSLKFMIEALHYVKRDGQPVIIFAKGVHHSFDELSASGADVIGLDWMIDIGDIRQQIGSRVALQGNLDPCVLYAHPDVIKREAVRVLDSYGSSDGHIFNLGHGILPDINPDHTRVLVNTVKEESIRYHQGVTA